jgi:hypothetical protein
MGVRSRVHPSGLREVRRFVALVSALLCIPLLQLSSAFACEPCPPGLTAQAATSIVVTPITVTVGERQENGDYPVTFSGSVTNSGKCPVTLTGEVIGRKGIFFKTFPIAAFTLKPGETKALSQATTLSPGKYKVTVILYQDGTEITRQSKEFTVPSTPSPRFA